ncbi:MULTISPECIES: HEAT repeat domain-containing protein [Synechococcaceae]|uniref:HEAT repeat domain-containing protein n=1 Tax=Synechococcaceae TaxID=1890426 RepID=UPI0008FF1654|nr:MULTISPECIES: HEAT repeat domain-containing protein [Synechococcaceae]MCT4365889.1 HEAT repeat domain-containing protein [Candidatus Regnicoccus frigidus MAG-AL1]APD48347.1 hypothetical protein BM449_08950 [Synechococcus sp. SynAce01]MCT0244828.1 HEAT repeat domain-containing protein [Synechococcus sp. CS-601]MCT4366678.1 HEAT repeat domain-containing protein [Candidatus Regnicoccus frigidus MAG-AL2]TWB92281.1 bilin biosynthesis protein [Synechococcus sp. Ace-Pa]
MSGTVSPQFTPKENDALLAEVRSALANGQFCGDDPKALARVVEGLADPRGLVRFNFAETLGAIGRPAIPFLLKALRGHENVAVRRAAAKTLTLIEAPEALSDLDAALSHDPDPVVQGSAAGAMARCGADAVPFLMKQLQDPDAGAIVKGLARWALSFIGAEEVGPLAETMQTGNPDQRAALVEVIAEQIRSSQDAELIALLIQCYSDPSADVRAEVVTALGNLLDPQYLPQLLIGLADSSGVVRRVAALALVKQKDPGVLSQVRDAAHAEKDPSVIPVMELAIRQLEQLIKID